MIDFSKHLNQDKPKPKIHPVEIYDTLDRGSATGPLRDAQTEALNKWFQELQDKRDIIIKMHTGQGKTLIGLLALQSIINQEKGPCLYVCPNPQLVNQTIEQAKRFGIPFVTFLEGPARDIPNEFLDGKKILICNVQKIFNGKSVFGLNNDSIKIHTIILDDAHACMETIRDAFTIKLDSEDECYKVLLALFDEDLEQQGSGTLAEIKEGEFSAFLPVPYWSWHEKSSKVLEILTKFKKDNTRIYFPWQLIKDKLSNCQCYISGRGLEIMPNYIDINQFGSFSNAKQRILMSATTMNDAFFVKGLGINPEAVRSPLTDTKHKWLGEKMIVMPDLFASEPPDRYLIINHLAVPDNKRNFGVVALVPSFNRATRYREQGCKIVDYKDIDVALGALKNGEFEFPIVLANRYDGIDLPDDSCRILLFDSRPYLECLSDQYEEKCREDSDITNIRIAQRIEQGLGRSVRGEKDYSVIILIGSELITFVYSSRTRKYFSPQTQRQIDIGLEVAKITCDSSKGESLTVLVDNLIRQCIIERNEGWKEFYNQHMNAEFQYHSYASVLDIFEIERRAEEFCYRDEYQKAVEVIQKYIDTNNLSSNEKGWYLQTMARLSYRYQPSISNKFQLGAYRNNLALLRPKSGITHQKIEPIDISRIDAIRKWISNNGGTKEIILNINSILEQLTFGFDANKFENALYQLGSALGFNSDRPDKYLKQGPDNLWCLKANDFILFECKTEVSEKRDVIAKTETGQMNTSCGWFNNNYMGANVLPVMIIPANNVSEAGAFNFDVSIMRKSELTKLKSNIRSFFIEISKEDLDSVGENKIQEMLSGHELGIDALKTKYYCKPFQKAGKIVN